MPLSHELRTPLNAILGNIELLLDGSAGPLSPQARACLADIQTASQHLMQQTHSLLLLVQALAAPAADDSTPVDLLERFRQTLRTGRSWHGAGRLDVKPGDARLVLRGDPFWLDALVAAAFELFRADAVAGGTLRLALESRCKGSAGVHVLHISWHAFDLARLPAAPLQLISAIVRMHGGDVEKAESGGLDLCWPEGRVVQS